MSKLTPKDYVEAAASLERAGFVAINSLLADGGKTISEVATTYGIDERTVELVKTTSSFAEYQTITRLETERESLAVELDEVKTQEQKVKPKTWHYVVAALVLLALAAAVVWGIVELIHWIGGLFQ